MGPDPLRQARLFADNPWMTDVATDQGRRRDLGELIVVWLLVASSVRVITSLAAAAISWSDVVSYPRTQQVGAAFVLAGGFADGPGVLLLLVTLYLVWRQHLSMRTMRWLLLMFMMTVVGAIIYGIGVYIVNRHGSSYLGLERFVDQDGFAFAYLIVSLSGCTPRGDCCKMVSPKRSEDRSPVGVDGRVDG